MMNLIKSVKDVKPDTWNTRGVDFDLVSNPVILAEIPKVRWFIRANGERVLQWHSVSSSGDDIWEDVQEVREVNHD